MKFILLLALVAGAAPTAWSAESSAPSSLRADRIELNQKTGISRYRGHVVVSQGAMRLTADSATVHKRVELLERVSAEGRPATFRDQPVGQPFPVEGAARRIEYQALERKLHLTGGVVLQRAGDTLEAGELHYHLNSESLIARTLDGQRVRAALTPRTQATLSGETP